MAQLLSEDEVRTALQALPGWEGGTERIVRTVPADPGVQAGLERAVMAVADEVGHHPVVERGEEAVRFVVWTHSAGGVTARDVELAGRIDRAIAAGGD